MIYKYKSEFLMYYDVINGICPICSSELFEDEDISDFYEHEESKYHYVSCSSCSFKDEYSKYFNESFEEEDYI